MDANGSEINSAGTNWLQRVAIGDALVSALLVFYGVYLYLGAGKIRVLPSYSNIGPRFFPYLIAVGTLVVGALLLVQALRGMRGEPDGGEDVDLSRRDNLRPVIVIAAALGVSTWMMQPVGFVLASTVLFAGVALGFGSFRVLRNLGIGFVLALTIYLSFTKLLSLTLPAGILPLLSGVLGQ